MHKYQHFRCVEKEKRRNAQYNLVQDSRIAHKFLWQVLKFKFDVFEFRLGSGRLWAVSQNNNG